MVETIKTLLEAERIDTYVFRPLEKCLITKEYLLKKAKIEDGFAVIFAIPYYTKAVSGNFSLSFGTTRSLSSFTY